VCVGTRGGVLGKSRDVVIVQDAGGVSNMGGKKNGGVGVNKGYISLSSSDFLVQHVRYDTFHSYPAFRWLTKTKRPCLLHAQPTGST